MFTDIRHKKQSAYYFATRRAAEYCSQPAFVFVRALA